MGSPPPDGSKKEVLKCLSVSSIVIAAAKTGNAKSKSTAVISILHTKSGKDDINKPGKRMLSTVTIKFIAPNKEEIPAKCKLKMAKSTAPPECTSIPDKGG